MGARRLKKQAGHTDVRPVFLEYFEENYFLTLLYRALRPSTTSAVMSSSGFI